jgi:thioredoxin-like negative regulator of GroEL
MESLDYGFRFASAIAKDTEDRSTAQTEVFQEYLRRAAFDEAGRCIEQIQNWRRGTAYADLAAALASAGQQSEARRLIEQAQAVRRVTDDWPKDRIGAHIAHALAALGDLEMIQQIGEKLPDEEKIKALMAASSGRVSRGKFDEEMKRLKTLEGSGNIDLNCGLVDGYLMVARQPAATLDSVQRGEALAAAARCSEVLPLMRRAESVVEIVGEYRALNDLDAGKPLLTSLENCALQDPKPVPRDAANPNREHATKRAPMSATIRATLLARVAAGWAYCGEKERATGLLRRAEALLAEPSGDLVEQAAAYAAVADGYVAANDFAGARRIYDGGLRFAAGQGNARPRALSVVKLCCSLGRSRIELNEAMRALLNQLLTGLKDPW